MKKNLLTFFIILLFTLAKAQVGYQVNVCGYISYPNSGIYTNTITMVVTQNGAMSTYNTQLNGSPQFCFNPITIAPTFGSVAIYTLKIYLDSCSTPSYTVSDTITASTSITAQLSMPCSQSSNCSVTFSQIQNPNGGITLSAISTGQAPFTYLWNTGDSTSTIAPSSNDVYSVTITDATGCSATNSNYVSVCSVNISSVSNGPNFTTLTANPTGTPPFTYFWANMQSTPSISANANANYCVYVTDAVGCTVQACDMAAPDTNCSASITQVGNSLIASSTGTWPFNYAWFTSTTSYANGTDTEFPPSPGVYACTVTDGNGCYQTAFCNFTNVAPPCNMSLSFNSTAIPGGSMLTANATGGSGAITYTWSSGFISQTMTANTTGIYCCYAVDANGCTATFCDTVVIGGNTCSTTLSFSIAGGGTLTAASSGVAPFTYQWFFNGTTFSSTQSYLFVLQPGIYSCVVTDANGCSSSAQYQYNGAGGNCFASISTFTTIGVPPNATLGLTVNSTGTGPFYYNWYAPSGVFLDSSQSIIVVTTGTYSVIVYDANQNTCTTSLYANLGLGNCQTSITPYANINNPSLLTANTTGGVYPLTYTWTLNGVAFGNSQSITPAGSGVYTVLVIDSSGCQSQSSYSVCPNVTFINQPAPGTSGFTVTAASNGVPPYTYDWTLNGLPLDTVPTITTSINGFYCYTVTDAVGCIVSDCIYDSTNVNGNCTAFFTATPDSLYLPYSNNMLVNFTSYPNGTPPFTFSWVFSDGTTDSSVNPQHMFYYSNVYNMMWAWANLTITDATGCVSTYSNSVPLPPINYNCSVYFTSSSLYINTAIGSVQFTNVLSGVDSTTTYLWDFGDGSTSTVANPSHTFTTSGMYYICLTATNSSGCVSTYCEPYYIDLSWWNNNPFNGNCTAGYIILPNTSIAGTAIIVDVSQVNNANYVWNTSNGFMTNAPTPYFNLNGPGTFTLCATVTDTVTGCTDTYCDSLSIDSLGNVFKSNSNNMLSSANGTVGFIVMSAPKPSNINGFENLTSNTGFALMPNPANNYVDIKVNATLENAVMLTYNITGEIIKEERITSKNNIYRTDISELTNGTYFVKLNGNSTAEVVKLMVNH